jgi:diguanylate cyclase (GGDEF)-like protein/PAS domain S-box-containing protein
MSVKERVLVVDDEEMNRNALSRRLERSGFEVDIANGGVEAIGKIAKGPYDLILLDQMMPGKSGSDVLRELRLQHSASALPVIMVTAVTESNRIAEALELGANDYITKPVDFTVALARIKAQLARKHSETARRVSDERYELAARAANDGLWDWDLVSNQIHYSARWKAMAGLSHGEIGNSPDEWFTRVHPDDLLELRAEIQRHLDHRTEVVEADYRFRLKDGKYRWMTLRGVALRDSDGVATRMAGSQSDVTQKKTTDPLTGLPNRILLLERLSGALDRARRDPATAFAVYFIDLDRFKIVNDTMGHAAGDQLLVEFGNRLRSAAGSTKSLVARLGGDEFAVLLEDVKDEAAALAMGENVIKAMRPPFRVGERELFISASVGIVVSRAEHSCVEDLLRDADIAMYSAKASGRDKCCIFNGSMREAVLKRLQVETDLRTALEKDQFVVYYQPRVDLSSYRICGFEALVRWKHPQLGLIQPDEFIPVAESTGMIREIGHWVLNEACHQMSRWHDRFPGMPWLDMAVNVSPVQLRDPDLVAKIIQILAETGLPPAALQIEITETTLMENVDLARDQLTALKKLGIGLKLDDFATGYSSLRHLQGLPFDTIKIDRSFIESLDSSNPESRELVRTILSMAENLSLGVIAEGIENEEAAAFLRDAGCKFGQGYYFSLPLSADNIGALLQGKV